MMLIWQWLMEQGENAWLRTQRWWTITSRWNRLALRWASIIIFGYPLAITLVALMGSHVLVGFLTLLPIMAALRVSWLITQRRSQGRLGAATAVIFGTAVTSDRGEKAGGIRRLAADVEDVAVEALRNLRRVLLVYGGIGAYYFFTPTENVGGIAIGIMILMLLMGGAVGESRGWRTAFFWLPLLVIIIVTAVLFSKEPWYQKAFSNNDAKAAPAETRECERSGGVTTCSLSLPTDGSRSEAIRASDFNGKLDWQATGPVGTLVCPDDNPCVRLREGAQAREILKFAHRGGGQVTVTLASSD